MERWKVLILVFVLGWLSGIIVIRWPFRKETLPPSTGASGQNQPLNYSTTCNATLLNYLIATRIPNALYDAGCTEKDLAVQLQRMHPEWCNSDLLDAGANLGVHG
jgi:hypothetical protein